MKWARRIIIALALSVLVGGSLAWYLSRAEPAWYTRQVQQAEGDAPDIEQRGLNKQLALRTQAAEAESQAIHAVLSGKIDQLTFDPITFSITDKELNKLFYTWAPVYRWDGIFDRYVREPVVIFHDGRIILAGREKRWNRIISVHMDPSLTDDGRLRLHLAGLKVGLLPVPQSVAGELKENLLRMARHNLPTWQKKAQLNVNGSANNEAAKAGMAKLLLDCISGQSSEPVVYLKVENSRWIPLKLTAIHLEDNTLTMQGAPIPLPERAAIIERLKH